MLFRHLLLLQDIFNAHGIFLRGKIKMSSKSCDLTPLNLILWSFFKNKMYINKSEIIGDFKVEIYYNVMNSFTHLFQQIYE